MADSYHNSTDGTPILRLSQSLPKEQQEQRLDECPPQHIDDELKGNDSGDDYSSGSDRSIEIDDGEDARGDSGSGGGTAEDNCNWQRRRKKRHGSHGSRRHKGGSRHKHRSTFQPYPGKEELGNTLKRKSLELQEKENAAAVLRRDEGQDQLVTFPVAPFNSTQFLMDEHSEDPSKRLKSPSDSNLKLSAQDNTNVSVSSSSKQDNLDALNSFPKGDQEFSDIYSTIHAENLQSMPKEELVKHYMSLEEQIASLQKKVAQVQQQKACDVDGKIKVDMDLDKDVAGSDTNSLSSTNEEFMDLTTINQPAIVVGGQNCVVDTNTGKIP